MPNNQSKSSRFKGKYCTLCNSVWELIPSVGIVKHPDFPSFGLEREDCAKCTKINPVDPHSLTLAEEVAEQRKDLFKKEVERINKEVERYNK